MKRARRPSGKTEMLREYNFRGGIRGKYAKQYASAVNVVALAPDVVTAFPNSEAVNKALRGLLKSSRKARKKTT